MDITNLPQIIRTIDIEAEISNGKQFPEIQVSASNFHTLMLHLRENRETWFDFLVCITGVDYGNDLGVIYHLRSTKHPVTIVVKTRTGDRHNPVIDTVSDIWKTADFQEREVYDLLGIKFDGHPDLRRLFLDSSWGFPLRKDYVDDINIVTR